MVTVKYVWLIMSADNEGEGGVFSILSLLKAKASSSFSPRAFGIVVTLAVVGSALILGDGIITPSLSIMSAWEGLEVISPRWSPFIPWLSIGTLIVLFGIQRFGTAKVGAIFAPAMAVWFAVLAVSLCRPRRSEQMSHQANGTRDEEVLAFVVTSLVDNPASVRVSSQGSGPERTLTVTVADSDRGLIVGRQGRNIRAIETIVAASVDGPPPVIEVTSAE